MPTLAEAGIDKKLSSRAQRLAAVPEGQFKGMIGEWRERVSVQERPNQSARRCLIVGRIVGCNRSGITNP